MQHKALVRCVVKEASGDGKQLLQLWQLLSERLGTAAYLLLSEVSF